jgi:hypothetical protein
MAVQTHHPAAIKSRRRTTGPALRAGTSAAVGLAALILALTTAGPQLAMNGPGPIAVAGTLAGVALLAFAYRAASAGRRRRVHLLGAAVVLLVLRFVVVPAFNIGSFHAKRAACARRRHSPRWRPGTIDPFELREFRGDACMAMGNSTRARSPRFGLNKGRDGEI